MRSAEYALMLLVVVAVCLSVLVPVERAMVGAMSRAASSLNPQ